MGYPRSFGRVGIALSVFALVAACGSQGDSAFGDGTDDITGGDSGNTGQLGDGGKKDGTIPELEGCATEQRKADPLPLDLFIMLDTSGSMAAQVAQNVSKYKAVADALNAFMVDPGSSGIGVGLQFFPLNVAGAPNSCTASAQCPGGTGPCTTKFCYQNGPIVFCNSSGDCNGGAPCIASAQCSLATNTYCSVPGTSCGTDGNGFNRGTCTATTQGTCSNADSCAATDYDTPAVAIGALPGTAAAVASALAAKGPVGNTPTSAALQGAVNAATAYAAANPTHTVVAVLATDGLPSECDTDIGNIAAIAAGGFGGSPSVKTFVIGVFAANEASIASTNLDQIAAAGGTGDAFIVTTGVTSTAQFVEAMNTIRGNALPCEYNIPHPESGTPDYDRLNVQHTTTGGEKMLISNRANEAACAGSEGWYYDVPPTGGATPTKIILCPTSCGTIKAQGGQVDVVIGCKTQVR